MNSADTNRMSPTREWCWGLPLVATRSLAPQERVELEEERRAQHGGCWGWGCGFPLILIGAVLGAVFISETFATFFKTQRGTDLGAVLTFALILLTVLAPAYALLRAKDLDKWGTGAFEDLRENRVSVYQGTSPQAEAKLWGDGSSSPSSPWKAPQAQTGPPREHTLEVLSASRRVWTWEGQRVGKRLAALPAEIAEVPDSATRAAAWASPLPQTALREASENATRRDLSHAEREEVTRHAKKLWKRPLWPAIGLSAWIGIPLSLHLLTHTPLKLEPMAYFIGAMALWCNGNLVSFVVVSRRLSHDLQNGFVVAARFAPDENEPNAPQSVEVLPTSGIEWTRNGAAAPWRQKAI